MHHAHFVADIAIVLGVGAIIAVLARRLGQPTILGYLFAGLIVGPYLPVPVFADVERVTALAEFGVVLVMFVVGLEFRIAKLLRVLPTAGLTGLMQVSFLIFCGFAIGRGLGWDPTASIFLGACVCISSTMVVSKVFEQREVAPDVRELVLGVLVIQDVIAIVLIAAMTGVAAGGGLAPTELALTLARLAGVLIAMLAGGLVLVPRVMKWVAGFESMELDAVVSIGLCFGLALLAESLGYSVALGAFIGGILVAESGLGERMEHAIQPVRDMFAAIFFVSIGMTVDPIEAWTNLPTALLVFAVVVVAQLLSVGVSGLLSGNGLRRSLTAGFSLGQIGEFAFILAAIGTGADVVPDSLQPILVSVAVLTAFTTPLAVGSAPRWVRAVDAALPRRLRSLITLYEEWLERVRARGAGATAPARKALRNLIIDAVALLLLLVIAAVVLPNAPRWLAHALDVTPELARIGVAVVALVIAVPFLVGAARNAVRYATLRAARLLGAPDASTPAMEVGSRALRAVILAVITAALGVPFTAALGFVVGVPYAAGAFLIGVAGVSVYIWRTAGRVDTELEAAVVQIGEALSTQPFGGPPSAHLSNPALISGLDDVVTVVITTECPAAGKTLAELNVRARTGATVIAVRRGTESATLPAGDQRLEEGDLLAMTGTEAALEAARRVLQGGDEQGEAGDLERATSDA